MITPILWFRDCSHKNKHLVGGKCSSLGELYDLARYIGFEIANGFAITTELYDDFIEHNNLSKEIESALNKLDYNNLDKIEEVSERLKGLILKAQYSEYHISSIEEGYNQLCDMYNYNNIDVAIRSSAIAEDMPNASFAGQQDTYLNINSSGEVLYSVKKCFSSLFNARAISYRNNHNISLSDVKISVAVQKMVRSDIGSAGVAFSIDPETGYNKAVVINSAFGLGELVVSGGIKPDEVILDKRILRYIDGDPIITKNKGDKNSKIIYDPSGGVQEIETSNREKNSYSITNNESIALGRYVLMLEEEYSKMYNKEIGVDVEWAIDGKDRRIYIIQTRPETVHSSKNDSLVLKKYILKEKGSILVNGIAVGDKISKGKVKVLSSIKQHTEFNKGDILVTEMTTPDWEPIMKISSGIITNKGGRTCHAAIVARELNINAVVGVGNSIEVLKDGQEITISCAEGETAKVYEGFLDFIIEEMEVNENKKLPMQLMLNVGNPETSFISSLIPNSGVGLARMEFIVSNYIKIHPLALCNYPNVPGNIKDIIFKELGSDHVNGNWFFIKRLARGMCKIASAFYPNNVIVRLSDFKSNEYRNLVGGEIYEPNEENPMIGWRGASRYYDPSYKQAFELECQAIAYARNKMKMTNIIVMIPFCRTPHECTQVIELMKKYGLERGSCGLQIYIMCEIPSNVIEADHFSKLIDGVSIGGNDLLQLTLGVDRDSDKITHLSSDENLSYRRLISMAIKTYKENNVKVGFCGQQPSDSVEFCKFLIHEGIDSISVTPDAALRTLQNIL